MKCECCGADIGEFAFDKAYAMPDEIWDLSEQEREARTITDNDLCRLDDRYFIRGVAYVPVLDSDQSYGWGIWVEVDIKDFKLYNENYDNDNSNLPSFTGKIANALPNYKKETTGVSVEIKLGNETQRPTLFCRDYAHPLAQEQRDGIPLRRVHEFNSN